MKSKIIRRVVSTLCGIICVGVLLFVAIQFPEYYCTYVDKKTLNNMVTTDIQVQTFETAYTSFPEKIHALAQARASGVSLNAVRMNEVAVIPDRKEMTRIVRSELKKMHENSIIPAAYKPKAKNLASCERYIIYAANEHDGMQGISCWKLEYESNQRDFTIYLDEEYHKVYQLELLYKAVSVSKERSGISGSNAAGKMAIDLSMTKKMSEDNYLWWDGLMRYYDLGTYSGFFDNGLEDFGVHDNMSHGTFIFDDIDNPMEGYRIIKYGLNDVSLNVGILLDKMIQF